MEPLRKYDCRGYRKCLRVAARHNDPGLDCGACGDYDREKGLGAWDYEGCMELLAAVFGDGRHAWTGARRKRSGLPQRGSSDARA